MHETMPRIPRLILSLAMLVLTPGLAAQDVKPQADRETILGPAQGTDRASWLAAMKAWRQGERARLNYDDAQYARPELLWGQSSFIQPQTMVEDRYFYDPVAGRYTVERFLADLNDRYGGIDSVLLQMVLGLKDQGMPLCFRSGEELAWDAVVSIAVDAVGTDRLHVADCSVPERNVRPMRAGVPGHDWEENTHLVAVELADHLTNAIQAAG